MMKRASLALPLLLLLAVLGCSLLSSGPEATVKRFYKAIEEEDVDEAADLVSSRIKSALGEDKIRAGLSEVGLEIKKKGGIKTLEITRLDVVGDAAEGEVKLTYGNGSMETEKLKLIKEKGRWKMDAEK